MKANFSERDVSEFPFYDFYSRADRKRSQPRRAQNQK